MNTSLHNTSQFNQALVGAGLVLPSTVRGIQGRGAVFEDVLERFDALVMRQQAAQSAEHMSFPPVVARQLIEKLGYLESFPQLIGSVHGFRGTDAQAQQMAAKAAEGQCWEDMLEITDVMMTPAACYPVYPLFSGLLPEGGRLVTVRGWCFRHEPSDEPTRMQTFRMREFIRVGAPDTVEHWRDEWLATSLRLLENLGLPAQSDVANDPFFGRGARMLAMSQREQRLKFEILVPIISSENPTAVCSFNWHQEHFTSKFAVRQQDGEVAHTACLGFGLERVTLALLKVHGIDPACWPASVRELLWN